MIKEHFSHLTGPKRLMQGNEACANGALYAGLNFYAGYPITPSTEIAEILSARLPEVGGIFIQMEDEIASLAACIGAAVTGAKAMTATSGPGFSLMQENIGYALMTETPCVIVNVQRLGPSTGLPTAPAQGDIMQARWGTHGDHEAIVLVPASVEEVFLLTVSAFNLAEKLRTPVIILMDEVVAHMREGAVIPQSGELEIISRSQPDTLPADYVPYRPGDNDVPVLASFGTGYRYHITGLFHDEDGFPTGKPGEIEGQIRRLQRKINNNKELYSCCEEYLVEDAEILLVSYGGSARSAKAAVREARKCGMKVGLFRPVTLWPFPEDQLRKACSLSRRVITAEMNLGQVAGVVRGVLAKDVHVQPVCHVDGTLIPPQKILTAIKEGGR